MKKLILIPLALLALASCSKKDSNTNVQPTNPTPPTPVVTQTSMSLSIANGNDIAATITYGSQNDPASYAYDYIKVSINDTFSFNIKVLPQIAKAVYTYTCDSAYPHYTGNKYKGELIRKSLDSSVMTITSFDSYHH